MCTKIRAARHSRGRVCAIFTLTLQRLALREHQQTGWWWWKFLHLEEQGWRRVGAHFYCGGEQWRAQVQGDGDLSL